MTQGKNTTVPVLMYHHVSPSPGMITSSPANFEDNLRWLKRHGYRSLSSDEFAAHLNGQAAPGKSVLITFDDGYLDNWVYAYPLLKKYGFSAMLFVVTSWIGDGEARPHEGKGQPLPPTPDHHECERIIAAGRADEVMLRWSEIERMRSDGVFEIHSHTHTHTRWDLTEPGGKNARMRQELRDSRDTLSERLGGVSEHFCWPQGYYDDDYVEIARQSGFRYLYTTHAFGRNLPGSDAGRIYRFAVRNKPGNTIGRRIRIAAHPVIGPVYNRWKLWKRSLRKKA